MSVQRRPKGSYFDLLTVDGCSRVFSAYDLGDVLAIESLIVENSVIVNLLERSETSRKTVVRTTTGSYFLKQVPWYCAEPALVESSASFASACAAEGLPVPVVHRTRDGALFAEHDGGLFTVSDLAVGMVYSGSAREVAASANVLARMHQVGASCDLPAERPTTTTRWIAEEHIELARRISKERGESTPVFDALCGMLDTVECPSALQQYPVHGDFIPWNIAYNADGSVAALYDFDNASMDSRLHDVGEALVAWAALDFSGKHAGLAADIRGSIDESVSAQFLQAYEQVAPLAAEEREALCSHVLGAWWEALLLGYVKGEIPCSELRKLAELPAAVEEWSKHVL